jgi:pSer/pThr/pTyr-binding forkhead associated (FHA) protein
MAAGKCAHCGTAFGKGAKFCKKCGNPLEEISTAEPPEALSAATFDELEKELSESATPDEFEQREDPTSGPETPPIELPLFTEQDTAELPNFEVRIIAGPNKGAAFRPHRGSSLVVGTGPESDIRLKDEYVSGRHALLQAEDGQLLLSDVGSTNGTFIAVTQARVLKPGDCFIVGSTVLCVVQEG